LSLAGLRVDPENHKLIRFRSKRFRSKTLQTHLPG
jgi:hypothetical protein